MSNPTLILAPRGRDAQVAADLLGRSGIDVLVCSDLEALRAAVDQGAACAVVAEEALYGPGLDALGALVADQPPWSDLPFVVLANGQKASRSQQAQATLDALRNVILLDRPLHAEALIRSVRSARNARQRQYDARDAIARSQDELEQLVIQRTAEREAALAQLHEAAKLETVGQLTGGIAHDFNNLLTPVIAGLDLLRRRHSDDPKSARLIEGAILASSRAATLVQRLLAFSRRQLLEPRNVDVRALVEGMQDLISRSIGPTYSLQLDLNEDAVTARVDPNQLELALLNLAINARDAMPGGGRLRIMVDRREGRQLATAALDGSFVVASVSDDGSGMDEATLKRAIEPFFSTKAVGKGTGLGLSMVHGLAVQSGGTLNISSAPGAGTIVEIWLPSSDQTPDATLEVNNHVIRATVASRVLLVDDEPLVRGATAEILRDLGYDVVQAGSGAEALSYLRSDRIELLVTDYLMPGMNGDELATEAKAQGYSAPILLLSGYAQLAEGDSLDLPRLSKPFRQADLAQRVAGLLKA